MASTPAMAQQVLDRRFHPTASSSAFVHAVWDGGSHAFLLDTMVAPDHQHQGIGTRIVSALIQELPDLEIDWLHVDYEPHLSSFYRTACGFHATNAGLLRLN